MTQFDPERLDYHLRRLDVESCRELVAELWAARGFETTRDGDVVVAVRDGETQVVYPVNSRTPALDRPVDVVVALDGVRDVPEHVRVLDASDVREMLAYAVERPIAVDICTRHLGALPDELAPPMPTRLRNRAETAVSLVRSTPFLLVLALALVALAGVTFASLSGDTTASPSSDTMPAATATPTTPSESGDTSPSVGIGLAGITNLSALADAHSRALENQSYTVWVDYERPRGREPNGPTVQRDTDVAVEGERYFGTTAIEVADNRTPLQEVYHDGSDWYISDTSGNRTRYRHVHASGGAPALDSDPSTLRYTLVTQYLSTPETAVTERTERNGRTLYRVVGRGRPTGLGVHGVENYTVVALVDSRGVVHDLTARYERQTQDGPASVVVEVTYGRFGSTTVTPPQWYEREFGNETRGDVPGAGAD